MAVDRTTDRVKINTPNPFYIHGKILYLLYMIQISLEKLNDGWIPKQQQQHDD